LHNIFFSEDYKKEFESIQKGHIYKDPTIYINISSKKTSSDAPKNMENWFVMINTPFNSGQDWSKLLAEARANVINKLNRILKTDVESLIAYEAAADPRNIEAETHSFAGSLYGTSSNSKGAAFFRHPNFSRKIKGLYFCGGSVHPGGGVPLVLSSAKIVDGLIPAINEK
jgi:phytoene dehydrogenase-like protein